MKPSYTRIDSNLFVVTGDTGDGDGCMVFYMAGAHSEPSMSYRLWFF